MAELLGAVASWRGLFCVLIVFGLAPGLLIRLIVLTYPKGHDRRAELVREMYEYPWWERPIWVADKLGLALVEAVPLRIAQARHHAGRRHVLSAGQRSELARFAEPLPTILAGSAAGGSALLLYMLATPWSNRWGYEVAIPAFIVSASRLWTSFRRRRRDPLPVALATSCVGLGITWSSCGLVEPAVTGSPFWFPGYASPVATTFEGIGVILLSAFFRVLYRRRADTLSPSTE